MKIRRIIELMWLGVAAVSIIEMAVGYMEGGFKNQHFQIFGVIAFTAFFMYFFRKRQRKKLENRN
ncbi:MAG: hypothetical protein H6605_06605 [Flavobacteriales bacterium]|nr:hypothetical protein [Flavobacteriales bacterium]